jgi:hypothetical protein
MKHEATCMPTQPTTRRLFFLAGLAALLALPAATLQAYELRQIPDEYESSGGMSSALSNAGVATAEPQAAVRLNPALLPTEKTYNISAGYHWPSAGREFFQAGVVDSKTSPLAAGVSYTGYNDDYLSPQDEHSNDPELVLDSPVIRRGAIGFGQMFGSMAIGAGATYVEANPVDSSEAKERGETRVKGIGLNAGIAGAFSPALRYGASAENLTNKKVLEYTPKTYRAGVTYMLNPTFAAGLDYRERTRVEEFEGQALVDPEDDELLQHPEQMVIGSLIAKVQEYLQLLGSYGKSLTDERRTYGAGAAVSGDHFTLSYMTTKPYMSRSASHQAVSLSVQVSM